MAERRGPGVPGRALLPLAAALAMAFAPACRAELKFTPGVQLTETWTDNVNQGEPGQGHREFIVDLAPSFALTENNRRLQLAASFMLHTFKYTDRTAPTINDSSRQLQADLKARLVDDFLFLDANAVRGQQAVSAFGPQVNGNYYSATNRTEVSNWRISPYIVQRLGNVADAQLRYTRDAVTTGREGYSNTHGDTVALSLASNRERRLGWNLYYDRQHLVDRLAGDSNSSNLSGNLSWRLQPGFALTAGAGYDDYDYHALGGRTRGRSWNAGFEWNPSPRTSLSASTGRRYYGQSHALAAMHRSRHTVWNINYSEAVTTSRSQFLLPATVSTIDLLDRLFMPNIPDAAERRLAVQAYLQATGLPASLANDVNYLSNRYMLQKQFQASAGFNGAHSLLLLSVFDTRNQALSLQQADSQLLGSTLSSLNDNVRQRGVSANFNYRLSSRSQASAGVTLSRSDSLTTAVRQDNRALRVGLTRQLERRLQGQLELRRVQGTATAGGHSYTENAVAGTLSMTL
jgi:uncharacterized protein (PEP-CTERM system associated)